MKEKQLDVLLINPCNRKLLYQTVEDYSAIEPNIWSILLNGAVYEKGYGSAILDMKALDILEENMPSIVKQYNPKLVLFVCFGQNPNDSTAHFGSVVRTAQCIKDEYPEYSIGVVGPHASALYRECLEKHLCLDIAFCNEGVYSLLNLLKQECKDLDKVRGIAYRNNDGEICVNPAEQVVPQNRLALDLPMRFDLVDIPWNKFRTSSWHTNYNEDVLSPFCSLYTSLNCPFQCNFCIINIIGRNNTNENDNADSFNTFRYWPPEYTIKTLDYLAENNIKNIKIADEMFALMPKHHLELCKLIIERKYNFNLWSYSRISTLKDQYLDIWKKAGMNYLGVGIESGTESIRMEATKGRFSDMNIRDVVYNAENHGLNIGANYIFGVGPSEDWNSMQQTFDLATELNTSMGNFYSAVALPGSPLYAQHVQKGYELPDTYEGYAFLSYDHLPTRSNFLSSAEICAYRDWAFHAYYTNPRFLNKIRNREGFGQQAVDSVLKMTEKKLHRKILGD